MNSVDVMQRDQIFSIGHFLAERRKHLGLSQREMADVLGSRGYEYAHATIGSWERGRFMPPIDDPKFVQTLAEILEVTKEEIMQAAGFDLDFDPDSEDVPKWVLAAYKRANSDQKKMINSLLRSVLEEDDESDPTG